MLKLQYITILLAMLVSTKNTAQLPPNDPVWELKFSDDFSGSSLDTSKWAQRPDFNQDGNTVSCISGTDTIIMDESYRKWYMGSGSIQPDTTNCKVNGGSVKLYSRDEDYAGVTWTWPGGVWTIDTLDFKYTTGMLYSKYKFRYGYFEIKFKLPSALSSPATYKGFGPNFWLFGSDAGANWSEIDIFEINAQTNLYTTNCHYETDSNSIVHWQDLDQHGFLNGGQWYTAAVNWTPDSIEFYLDNVKITQLNLSGRADSLRPMNIWVDINTPSADGFCSNFDTINTSFPYTYEIDYVKVYQKKMACDTSKSYCNVTSSGYTSKVYQDLTIGGTGCSANISTANTSSHGVNYVLLNEGFVIDASTNAYINVLNCETQSFYRSVFPISTPIATPPAFIRRQHYLENPQQ